MNRVNFVRKIIIHEVSVDSKNEQNTLSNNVNQFHIDILEHKLFQMNLSMEQNNIIIDKIITNLKL